ncbi:MAG: nitrous oxide reductase accessory protein NosL [Acidimicrobiia bacterium]
MQHAMRLTVILLTGVLAAACGTPDDSGPPEINYGRDICVECGMIINEARFAAAYRLDDGTQKIFDDVGGLLIHQRSTADSLDPGTTWVHDYETEEWVAAADAYFVPTLSVTSPMGHSIVSFADRDRAEAFAADVDGEVITWSTVMELPVVDGLVGNHHTDMDQNMDMSSAPGGSDHQHNG